MKSSQKVLKKCAVNDKIKLKRSASTRRAESLLPPPMKKLTVDPDSAPRRSGRRSSATATVI
jgi:hypothetical protein